MHLERTGADQQLLTVNGRQAGTTTDETNMTETKNNAKKTKQNDAAAMNEGEGADVVPAIQAAVEAQQAQQKQQGPQGSQKPQKPTEQEQHEQQGTADGQQKEQEGAFQLDLTQEVTEAREGAASLRPVEGGTLARNEL